MDAGRVAGLALLGAVAYLALGMRTASAAESPDDYGPDWDVNPVPVPPDLYGGASLLPASYTGADGFGGAFDWLGDLFGGGSPVASPDAPYAPDWGDWQEWPVDVPGGAYSTPDAPVDWNPWASGGDLPGGDPWGDAGGWTSGGDLPGGEPAPVVDWNPWTSGADLPGGDPWGAWNGGASMDQASANLSAFLRLIRTTEGTEREANPYATTYGYSFVISDFRNHPALLGWRGVTLPDNYCAAAGLAPGCVSTAAGAYQIIKPTWVRLQRALSLPDFSPESQDAAALELLRQRGALPYIERGDLTNALRVASREWASLPYSTSGQPKYSLSQAQAIFADAGGMVT